MNAAAPAMTASRIGDYRHATSVPLDPDEYISYRGFLFLRGTPAWGDLFLTTKRLVWIRQRLALPFGRKVVSVPLSEIEGWSIERPRWWGWGFWPSVWPILRVRTTSERLDFMIPWRSIEAEEWAEALEDVMVAAGYATRDSGA